MHVIVMVMMVPVNSMRKRAAQSPDRIRHAETDQQKPSNRDHVLAEPLEQLGPEEQGEEAEQHGDRHVAESTKESNTCGASPRPSTCAGHGRDRHPMVGSQRM